MNGGEHLQGLDVPESRHSPFSLPKRLVRVFGSVVEPTPTFLVGSVTDEMAEWIFIHQRYGTLPSASTEFALTESVAGLLARQASTDITGTYDGQLKDNDILIRCFNFLWLYNAPYFTLQT